MSSQTKFVFFALALSILVGAGLLISNYFDSAPSSASRPSQPAVTNTSQTSLPPIARPDSENPLGGVARTPQEHETPFPGKADLELGSRGGGGKPDINEDTHPQHAETTEPSTLVPPLVSPPELQGTVANSKTDGKVIRLTVEDSDNAELPPQSILGTQTIADGIAISSSQDTVIPFSLVQDIARDVVNGYWPQGTHVLAVSSGAITTNFALLNTRYGMAMNGKYATSGGSGNGRQRILDYVLMPSMVEGLYRLYAERFIRLVNHEAKARLYMRQGAAQHLENAELGEMYGLYARSLRNHAGCVRAFMSSPEIRYNTEKFILAEHEANSAYMEYQEQSLDGGAGSPELHKSEHQYRMKVAQRESARQSLSASFRRFTDTRNMDTNDLVFLAKWLNRRSVAHSEGVLTLTTVLEALATRMEREQQSFISQ